MISNLAIIAGALAYPILLIFLFVGLAGLNAGRWVL